jgi:peptide/nickel transport system substrate-binding protein
MPHPSHRPLLVAALIGALAACGIEAPGPESASEGGGAPEADEPLQVVGPFEVHSIEPAQAGGVFTRLEVAETLVGADPDGTLRTGLAASWEVSEDERTWRFELRDDARFHDGEPVTAAAVVSTLEDVREQPDSPLSAAPVASVEETDGGVEVVLEEAYAPLPAVLAHTSTQILAPSSYGADGSVEEIVGSGPYEVTRVRLPDTIELATAATWDGDPPGIDEIVYAAVGRAETRSSMAESGQADVTFGMEPATVDRLRGSDAVEIVSVTLPRAIQLKLDAGDPALGDVRVRRALSLALDREGMATALLRDAEMAATQLFPPSLDAWHQPELAPLEHDPARARALLDEAGFELDPEDGVRSRDGRPLALTLRTFTDRPELPTLATAIQSAFTEIGVDLQVDIGNSSDIPAGHQDGSLDLGLYARNFALTPDPLATLLEDFHPDGADWGAMNWSDEELNGLLTSMASEGEGSGSDQDRARVASILQDELPVVPVAWYRQSAVLAPGLDGLVLDPLERDWGLSSVTWADD